MLLRKFSRDIQMSNTDQCLNYILYCAKAAYHLFLRLSFHENKCLKCQNNTLWLDCGKMFEVRIRYKTHNICYII